LLQGGVDSLAAGFGHSASDPHIRGQVRKWSGERLESLRAKAERLQTSATNMVDVLFPRPSLGFAGAGGEVKGSAKERPSSRPSPTPELTDKTAIAPPTRPDLNLMGDRLFMMRLPRAGATPVEWLESMKDSLIRIEDMHVQEKLEPLKEIWKHLERFDR